METSLERKTVEYQSSKTLSIYYYKKNLHCSLPFFLDLLLAPVGNQRKMGCISSAYYAVGRKKKKKKKIINEISVFVPFLRVPVPMDMQRTLRGLIPKDLADRITSLRSRIIFIAQDTGGSAIRELTKASEEYLSLVVGLTKKEYGLQDLVQFRWKDLEVGKQEICVANSWFELLSIIHMMSMLMLMEANLKLIPKEDSLPDRLVSPECMRDAVDLLVKAAGYSNFCVHAVLVLLPPHVRDKLPSDMQERVFEAISHQALALGTEVQLGLAVQSQNATLSVKRRLACEQLGFFTQAYICLSEADNGAVIASRKKQLLFLKWKHLEAKAAAYYYHGLFLDKGTEPSSHVNPVTRASPPWGAMKHLHTKIPETASKKSQMYGYLLDQEKGHHILPDLPEFQLCLKPDDYELPELDPAWDCGKWEIPRQTLKEHLDLDDELQT
ncbi:hypothetical protein OROMI_022885 [Orobanche minor]